MKKALFSIFGILTLCFALTFTSCNSCKSANEDPIETVADTAVCENQPLVVENLISTDRQYMYMNYGGDYRWFETCIVLQDFLDEENDGTITGVSNVFQVVDMSEDGKSADVFVILASHTADTTAYDVKHAFWVEDYPLNEEVITVTFEQAYEKLMATNCPKPHSKHVVLRKQVGPVDANPQYIFGNMNEVVFVDAMTGEVNTDNPAFPKEKGFKMPLGEWP